MTTGKTRSERGWTAAALMTALAMPLMSGCEEDETQAPSPERAAEAAPSREQPPPQPAPPALEPASHQPRGQIAGLPSFADLVERARPTVINIYTRTRQRTSRPPSPFLPFAPQERISESLGSGFLIDESGLALTNHHVIKGATEIEVRLLDERRFKARIVGQDPKTDVALIQLQGASELPHLELGDSDELRVGEWVVAIGNPLGLTSTVTAGITSATGRKHVPLGGELVYQDFIQTDASIHPGNSGGPLIDTRGRVLGINTAISAEAQGIGFAIPINMVRDILPQLKEEGEVKRSWLGIYVDEVSPGLAHQLEIPAKGALVRDVVPGGPADVAKLEKGDVILKLDDQLIEDASHLSWIAGHKGIGKRVDIELQRGSQRLKTRLKLGALPD